MSDCADVRGKQLIFLRMHRQRVGVMCAASCTFYPHIEVKLILLLFSFHFANNNLIQCVGMRCMWGEGKIKIKKKKPQL